MISFNVALNTEQNVLFQEAIRQKYPGVGFQFTFEMNRVGFKTLEDHTMPEDAHSTALGVLMDMPLPIVQEVNHVIPKTHKPLPQRIVRGEVRVEQRAVGK